ncbi:MAG: ribose 5-phosphate isomerase A [Bacteroidetes bacterium QS_8_68_15]|nr:MAG: ribose 5-phosphate isomerase A [Bacteroidetes bacterium QS_8_68_15]
MRDERSTFPVQPATNVSDAKQAAGEAGAALVEDGMRIGLGTGSTAACALRVIGRRLRDGALTDVAGVPTSFAAERRARSLGIPLTTLDEAGRLDLALDGADEVTPALNLIKGRGAAHAREKVIAAAADRFVVLADPSKRVERLGEQAPVPVEVMPMALAPVTRFLREEHGARAAELRSGQGKDGPVVTDQGLWVIDVRFDEALPDVGALAGALDRHPGVLDHGLFLGYATDVLVGRASGDVESLRRG